MVNWSITDLVRLIMMTLTRQRYTFCISIRSLSLPFSFVYYCFSEFNNKIIISERLWSSASHTAHWVQCDSLYHFIQRKMIIIFIFFVVLQSSFFFFVTSKWNVYFVFHFFFFSVFRSGNRPFVKWTLFFFFFLSSFERSKESKFHLMKTEEDIRRKHTKYNEHNSSTSDNNNNNNEKSTTASEWRKNKLTC